MKKPEFKSASFQEITKAIQNRNQDGNFGNLIKFIDSKIKTPVTSWKS